MSCGTVARLGRARRAIGHYVRVDDARSARPSGAILLFIAASVMTACGGGDAAGGDLRPASAEEAAAFRVEVKPLLDAGYCPVAREPEVILGVHMTCTPDTSLTLYSTSTDADRYVDQLARAYCGSQAGVEGPRKYAVTGGHLVLDGPGYTVDAYSPLIGAVASVLCP